MEILEHIDIYRVSGKAEPSQVNAIDYIVASAKIAKLEQRIEDFPSPTTSTTTSGASGGRAEPQG